VNYLVQVAFAATVAAWVSGCAAPNMDTSVLQSGVVPRQAVTQAVWTLPPSSPMPAGQPGAEMPAGFISFCIRFHDQCALPSNAQSFVALTPASWDALAAVNGQTNNAIIPEDDLEHYGRAEYWDIPNDGRGNCKDYALTKRKLLIDAGFPELALRIAIVLTPAGERHAVLTVATDRGDFVLDNLTGEIRPWSQTDYVWIERQASTSPWNWVTFQRETAPWANETVAAISARPSTQSQDTLIAALQ